MGGDAFVVVFLKPEISTGFFKFSASEDDDEDTAVPSSIPGVSAVEAAFLMPNGHITDTVITRIEAKGLEIVDQRMNQLTKAEARHLFSYELRHRFDGDEQAFAVFLNSITSGPTLSLVLKLPAALALGDANAAIKQWMELAGDWDPVVARKKALAASTPHDRWPLRALCGINSIQNGISSSPHVCCSRRERYFLLPPAVPQLERATIVLLPSFHSNLSNGKDILLSTIGREVHAIIVESYEGYSLSDDQVITLCGLKREINKKTREQVVQLTQEIVGDKGVEVFVLEGLDLNYTLRAAVGPANVEFAKLYFPESVRAQVPSKLPSVELPTGLHPDEAADDDALGFESGLFLSFESKLNFEEKNSDFLVKGIPIEFTLGLVKPNAACKPEVVAEILRMINLFGFTVERQRRLLLSRDQAAAFYSEHRGKAFFETLLGFMTSGEIVALHLSRPHAIKAWRSLMGPTNSTKAREAYPWTLRARFGVDGTRNATHGSDSTASAARELDFFFGNLLSASSTASKVPSGAFVNSQTVAQRPIVLSGTAETNVEKVLAQGLKELMARKVSDPLEACQWLGEWLVMYRSRGFEEAPETHDVAQKQAYPVKAKINIKRNLEEATEVKARKVVAITLDSTVDNILRGEILDIISKRLKEARYEVIDVAAEVEKCTAVDTAVVNLVKILNECGRRRCVLFGCEELTQNSAFHREFTTQAPSEWQINFVVHLELQKPNGDSFDPGVITHLLPFDIPVLHFTLPSASLQSNAAFHGLFRAVFDPNIVLLADPDKLVPVTVWKAVANHYGFYLLTFDQFVSTVKTSNDNSDEARLLLQLVRSGANVAPKLILTSLRRVIIRSLPGSSNVTQKFMLLGFPWSDIQATELEQAIGQPQSVLFVEKKGQKFKPKTNLPDFPVWMAAFRKNGLVKRIRIDSNEVVDQSVVGSAVHSALAPVIGCFLGKCDQIDQVQIAAKDQGFVWVECTSTPSVQKLREFLRRAHAGREKFLLYGYPQTPTQATDFLNIVGAPQFVLHDSSSTSPVALEIFAVFDAQPAITQLDVTQSSNGLSKLRSTLFRKQVAVLVGSVDTLNAFQLGDVVAVLGYDVIDLRQDEHQKDDEYERLVEFERRVQAVQAPRCLLVGAPETPSFYHALEVRIGCAMHKILILQHVQVRVRVPDAMDDGDSDAYSDEEQSNLQVEENGSDGEENILPVRGGVKWSKVMKALSPQLSKLLQTFTTSSTSSISIDVIGFLENTLSRRVLQDIVARLRPRFFGIVGHPYSFYQTAARYFCRRNLAGFIDLSCVSSSFEALEALENLVATTSHSVYCLDGFPRSSLPDAIAPSMSTASSTPRHVAQQLWELDRRLGPFSILVHFTTALGVLEERTPEHVSRRMLDLAQDALELGSLDLLHWLTTGKNRHQTISEVTCDQTLEVTQEELESVLHRVLRPTRPVIKQKGG